MVSAAQDQVAAVGVLDPDRPWIRRFGTGHSDPTSKPTGRTAPNRWPLLVAEFDADQGEWERLNPPPTTANNDQGQANS